MARGDGSWGRWDGGREFRLGRQGPRHGAANDRRPPLDASREWWLWGSDPAGMLAYLMGCCHSEGAMAFSGACRPAVMDRLMRVLAGECPALRKSLLGGFSPWDIAFSFLPRIGQAVGRHEATDAGRRGLPCPALARYAGKIREAVGDPWLLAKPGGGAEWAWCRHGAREAAGWPPPWLVPEAVAMAQVIEREAHGGHLDAVGLAALADRLEEAGCTLVPLLAHLRSGEACPTAARFSAESCRGGHGGNGQCKRCGGVGYVRQEWPHGPVCWAVDMVLGRGRAFA